MLVGLLLRCYKSQKVNKNKCIFVKNNKMAETLNTDVAAEVNITARRNDTFKLLLEVKDSQGVTMDLNNLNTSSTSAQGFDCPEYQGKMTILSSSGEEILSVFSEVWNDAQEHATQYDVDHPKSRPPSSTASGYWTGTSAGNNLGINLLSQSGPGGSGDNKVAIMIPYDYMDFQSGEYKYDLQIRYKNNTTNILEYTTWLYGKFTLRADITQ